MAVLTLDCQATGPNPDRDHLLEVAWARITAETPLNRVRVFSHLIKPSEGVSLPRRIVRVTGISREDLRRGVEPRQVWKELISQTEQQGSKLSYPTVIHFSRFEAPYLSFLHAQFSPTANFPFELICSHQIACRLLPKLPRKGLRAVAGYLGHSVPEKRRSRDHVLATCIIWAALVDRLERIGVQDLPALRDWLATSVRPDSTQRWYPMAPSSRANLPDRPGVYRMLRSNGDVLYIGKAKSLKRRVNSYFRPAANHAEHTLEMLAQAKRLAFTTSGSAVEAALMEVHEIQRFNPPYNRALRVRERGLAFLSRDLQQWGSRPSTLRSVGPIPDGPFLSAFAALADYLAGRETAHPEALFPWTGKRVPEPQLIDLGIRVFRQKYAEGRAGLKQLLTVGKKLLTERVATPGAREQGEAEKTEVIWSAERILACLEEMTRQATRLILRGRWLLLLSESALRWRRREDREWMLIVCESGRLAFRGHLGTEDPLPILPGFGRSSRSRKEEFAVEAYDRLRVLSSELKRLVAEKALVELRISRQRVLRSMDLAFLFKWV